MHVVRAIKTANWQKIALFLGTLFVTFCLGRSLAQGLYLVFLVPVAVGLIWLLYIKQIELFIVFVLIVFQEFFFLVPREAIGGYYYKDFLFIVLVLTGGWFFFRERNENQPKLGVLVILFLGLVAIGCIYPFFAEGQSPIEGVKNARTFLLIIFYFVFMGKKIDMKKLFKYIIIVGVIVSIFNNIQYFFWGERTIFYFEKSWERLGQVRYHIGGVYIIFASIIAFGEYLRSKKLWYLIAFSYIAATAIFQGQTRAVIWGFGTSSLALIYLTKSLNLKKTFLFGIPFLAIFIWIAPHIQSTFFSNIYDLTRYEIESRSGNVGIRFESHRYYMEEFAKSPIIGRGIWSEGFEGNNPQDKADQGIHLSDVGITNVFFHWGILGVLWLILFFIKIYRLSFESPGRLKEHAPFGLIGFLLFFIFTMPTLNSLVSVRGILFLALILALFTQMKVPGQNDQVAS